jgi:hypothetical protein
MVSKFDLDKIKFATDEQTYERAVSLYTSGKVTQFKENIFGYSAVVLGTKPYDVFVEACRYGYGTCECYLGQTDVLCKHIVAVAMYAIFRGKKLNTEDKTTISSPSCSKKLGQLTKAELMSVKKLITGAMKHIKNYSGPSRTWFTYQNSLQEGRARLSKIVSELPVSTQTTRLLVDMLLRLDERLSRGGVDDSDGTIGGFMEDVVRVLEEYAKFDQSCLSEFQVLKNKQTCFGWEESLTRLLASSSSLMKN